VAIFINFVLTFAQGAGQIYPYFALVNQMATLSLYTETLYQHDNSGEMTPIKGLFQKKICVVVLKADYTAENEATLLKMIANCNFTLDDCAIYTLDAKEHGAFELACAIRPEKLILFGVHFSSETTLLITEYYNLKKIGDMQVLISETLTQLNTTVQHKHLLWAQLKIMFGIK
jgi:hypothetical protein